MALKRSKTVSKTKAKRATKSHREDYPLQGTSLDLPMETVLGFSTSKRKQYIRSLITGFGKKIKTDEMTLKRRTSFTVEMRDLRKILNSAPDAYLYTDEKNGRRWVLGKGSPGSTHVYWSRNQIWKMKTKGGYLQKQLLETSPKLITTIDKLLDSKVESKKGFRNTKKSAILNILSYLEMDKSSGCAFPPFHARFFADKYLPQEGDGIVVDPCAGWGGRLLGTLLVSRTSHVQYIGIDPEERNQKAYEGLTRRATLWLKREISGTRSSMIYYQPFEDWIASASAKKLFGQVDLVITSPPYFGAENYNPENPKQSANRYNEYIIWREEFYRRLMQGAFDLLKPGGHFVLNIADVAEAPMLERDARKLAVEEGFVGDGFYKLAMSMSAATRKAGNARHATQVDGKQFKHEPVFVFKKPNKSA